MEVNEVQVQLDKMKAETKVRLAALKQESKVRVQTLNADGNLEVTKLAAEKERVLKDLHARAVSEAAQLKAETDLYEQETLSAARLTAARNEAASQELMAKAEGVAAPYVEARKQFETRQKQMKVWASLAQNKELVVSGESSDELNTILLCDAIMTDKQSEETKAQVLAEMLVMQRGSKVMLNLGGTRARAASSEGGEASDVGGRGERCVDLCMCEKLKALLLTTTPPSDDTSPRVARPHPAPVPRRQLRVRASRCARHVRARVRLGDRGGEARDDVGVGVGDVGGLGRVGQQLVEAGARRVVDGASVLLLVVRGAVDERVGAPRLWRVGLPLFEARQRALVALWRVPVRLRRAELNAPPPASTSIADTSVITVSGRGCSDTAPVSNATRRRRRARRAGDDGVGGVGAAEDAKRRIPVGDVHQLVRRGAARRRQEAAGEEGVTRDPPSHASCLCPINGKLLP